MILQIGTNAPKSGKSNTRLRVRRVVDAPLHEVSGICLRRGRNGRMSLIAVGDRMSKLAWFSLPGSDDGRIDWHTSDIANVSGSMLPKHDPQVEAVCADGLGRVLLLQETPPRVELIDPKKRPTGVCERVTTRWPDSRTALWKPGFKKRRGLTPGVL